MTRRAPSPVAPQRANMMEASRIVQGTTSHCARKRLTFSRWVQKIRQSWVVAAMAEVKIAALGMQDDRIPVMAVTV